MVNEDPNHLCMLRTTDGYCRRPHNHSGPHVFDLGWKRPGWDDYFMGIAREVARRGDCRRRQVGCVLVDADHRIIGTGYNGAEPGGPSCLRGECPRGLSDAPRTEDYSNCVAIHAEANALLFARTSCHGATAYVSSAVCDGCAKLMRGAGVVRVVQ